MTSPVSGGFQLTPATGLNDTVTYPTTPVNETAARQQFMDMYWQLMNEMNLPTLSAAAYAQYNKLINGNFDVWQRGTSFTYSTAGNRYTADRWRHTINSITSGSVTIAQNSIHIPVGSMYSMELNYGSAVNAADNITQILETKDVQKLRGKKVTLSFQAKVLSGTLATNAVIQDGTDTDAFPSTSTTNDTLTVNLTSSFQTFTLTHTVQSGANAMAVRLFNTTKTGFTGVIYISQVQVNVGDQALPFQPRSFSEELALCLRYYEKSYNLADAPGASTTTGSIWVDSNGSSSMILPSVNFKVRKRTNPTVTIYSTTGASGKVRNTTTSADLSVSTDTTSENNFSSFIAFVASSANDDIRYQFTADAEI